MDHWTERDDADREEASTPLYIHPGTVIGVHRASWPAVVQVDVDATPIVAVPLVPHHEPRRAEATPVVAVPSVPPRRDSSLRPPPLTFEIEPPPSVAPPTRAARAPLASRRGVGPAPWILGLARSPATWGALAVVALALETTTASSPPMRAGASRAVGRELAAPRVIEATRDALVPAAPNDEAPAPSSAPASPAAAHFDRLTEARRAYAAGRFDDARRAYDAALVADAHDVEALAGLADVARATGATTRAAELYDRALALAPSYVPARIGRADLLWSAGERAKGAAEYRAVLDLVDDAPAYVRHRAERLDPPRTPVTP
jgi:hypothetical protein